MPPAATADLTPNRVPHDPSKHKILSPMKVGDETVYVDLTLREQWFLAVRPPHSEEFPTIAALRWTRPGHEPEPVTIVEGYQP